MDASHLPLHQCLPVTPFPARSPSIIYGNATIPLSICHGWKADPQQVLAEATNRPFATQMGRSAARFIGGSGVTLCAYKVSYRLSVLIGIPRMSFNAKCRSHFDRSAVCVIVALVIHCHSSVPSVLEMNHQPPPANPASLELKACELWMHLLLRHSEVVRSQSLIAIRINCRYM